MTLYLSYLSLFRCVGRCGLEINEYKSEEKNLRCGVYSIEALMGKDCNENYRQKTLLSYFVFECLLCLRVEVMKWRIPTLLKNGPKAIKFHSGILFSFDICENHHQVGVIVVVFYTLERTDPRVIVSL
jgi:hypothetical protein